MPSGNLVCTECRDAGVENPFSVPAPLDPIGAALMSAHLDEHKRAKRPS